MELVRDHFRVASSALLIGFVWVWGGCQAAEPGLVAGSDEALGERTLAISTGVGALNLPVVGFEYADWVLDPELDPNDPNRDRTKKVLRYPKCSGTLINEHWILTAAHCVQNFSLTQKDPTGEPLPKAADARSFKAYLYQKRGDKTVAITRPDLRSACSGPKSIRELAEEPRNTACALELTAYPFNRFDPLVSAPDDVALLKINDLFWISTNVDANGAAIEPEAGALPLRLGGPLTTTEPLVPWGWGLRGEQDTTSIDYRMDLRAPANGGFFTLAGSAQLFPQAIQIPTGSAPDAVRMCRGDSGGPLLATRGGRQVIVGVASQILPDGPGICAKPGEYMSWARVDTPEKRIWIEKTIAGSCRRDPDGVYSECWPSLCNAQGKCSQAGSTCRPRSGTSLTGLIDNAKQRPKRCLPKGATR